MNKTIIDYYVHVFGDEINISVENLSNELLLLSKKEILNYFDFKIPVMIEGYGRIHSLLEAVDETEFYYNILSFFNRHGKILFDSKHLDGMYYQTIALSYYNIDTNEIEILRTDNKAIVSDLNFSHLEWLEQLKYNMYELLRQLSNINQTSSKIKIGSRKFKQLIKNAEANSDNETGDSI